MRVTLNNIISVSVLNVSCFEEVILAFVSQKQTQPFLTVYTHSKFLTVGFENRDVRKLLSF